MPVISDLFLFNCILPESGIVHHFLLSVENLRFDFVKFLSAFIDFNKFQAFHWKKMGKHNSGCRVCCEIDIPNTEKTHTVYICASSVNASTENRESSWFQLCRQWRQSWHHNNSRFSVQSNRDSHQLVNRACHYKTNYQWHDKGVIW